MVVAVAVAVAVVVVVVVVVIVGGGMAIAVSTLAPLSRRKPSARRLRHPRSQLGDHCALHLAHV